MKSLVFLALLVATVSAKPFIGGLITGLSNLGTELGKKTTDIVKKTVDLGADALANTANVGLNTGKVAVTGMGGIGKQVLDQAGSVGHNAIDLLGVVGDGLGGLGTPVKAIEGVAHKILDKGVDAGKAAITTGEDIGTKSMTVADKVVVITAGTGKNAANAGAEITKGSLNAINEGVNSFWG